MDLSAVDALGLLVAARKYHEAVSLTVLFRAELRSLSLDPVFIKLTAECVATDASEPALHGD